MSSATSTNTHARPPRDVVSGASLQPWQFFLLVAMIGSIAAVLLSPQAEPAALLLLSAAIIAVGLVGMAAHAAVRAFVSRGRPTPLASESRRETLSHEKMRVLHAIKEVEFDRKMNKLSEKDYKVLLAPLRLRAVALMKEIEDGEGYRGRIEHDLHARLAELPPAPPPLAASYCTQCGTAADPDAKFCKRCGAPVNR